MAQLPIHAARFASAESGARPSRLAAIRARLHHEFWPAWLLYLPLLPYLLFLALRHRSLHAFLAANPGIENGGGFINESKFAIAHALESSAAPQLHTRLIRAGGPARDRAALAMQDIAAEPRLAFPVILKPDRGQRGYAVRVAHSHADVLSYLQSVTGDVLLQQYHPGPEECGILWVRDTAQRDGQPAVRTGAILSITRKTFPVIRGDGIHTLKDLILQHPRHRLQAKVFMARFHADLNRVLLVGESLRLAEAGNHCQGTRFSDGSDFITPELSAAIDRICAAYPGGLDFGRFDIRYESDAALRRGTGFAIVELNGTSAEATAIYDPDRSVLWAYRLLFRQWRMLFAAGAARVRSGRLPPALTDVLRWLREHRRQQSGSAVSS